MTTSVPRSVNGGDWPAPGSWRLVLRDDAQVVYLCCPGCGSVAELLDHSISAYGDVSPSVQCRSCGFHNDVHLEMYTSLEAAS